MRWSPPAPTFSPGGFAFRVRGEPDKEDGIWDGPTWRSEPAKSGRAPSAAPRQSSLPGSPRSAPPAQGLGPTILPSARRIRRLEPDHAHQASTKGAQEPFLIRSSSAAPASVSLPPTHLAVVAPGIVGSGAGFNRQIALIPDGRTLLYTAMVDGFERVMRLDLGETEGEVMPDVPPSTTGYSISSDLSLHYHPNHRETVSLPPQ